MLQRDLYKPAAARNDEVVKKKSAAISVSSSSALSLTAELSNLRNKAAKERGSERSSAILRGPRSEKKKSLWSTSNKGIALRQAYDESIIDDMGTSPEIDFERSKQALEQKAKKYRRLKRGLDVDPTGEMLVEYVEGDRGASTDEASEDEAMVDTTDEFGRTVTVKKSRLPDPEIEASPPPTNIIYDANYMPTFKVDEAKRRALEAVSNAPPVAFYDATKEVRNRGTGFYQFSQDHAQRERELQELRDGRQQTLREREAYAAALAKRQDQLDRRRALICAKREEMTVQAGESWLEGFMGGSGSSK